MTKCCEPKHHLCKVMENKKNRFGEEYRQCCDHKWNDFFPVRKKEPKVSFLSDLTAGPFTSHRGNEARFDSACHGNFTFLRSRLCPFFCLSFPTPGTFTCEVTARNETKSASLKVTLIRRPRPSVTPLSASVTPGAHFACDCLARNHDPTLRSGQTYSAEPFWSRGKHRVHTYVHKYSPPSQVITAADWGEEQVSVGPVHTGRVSRFACKFVCKPFDVACNLCEHSHLVQCVALLAWCLPQGALRPVQSIPQTQVCLWSQAFSDILSFPESQPW